MAKSLKLNSDLWQRVEQHAQKAGYSSPEEFVEHLLEKELAKDEDEASQQEIERRLKGLGYLE
jgi:metal-responsive CopG/Arc/MetJ family transcriptional regulator